MAAVVVLVAIALAGIVLAQRQRASGDSSTTQGEPGAMTGAPALPRSGPNEVVFADASDKLPADANAKLLRIADKARTENKTIVINARVPVSDSNDPQVDLARRRAEAVRNALQTIALQVSGAKAPAVRTQIIRMGSGSGLPPQADRVELEER
jgi:outer membrane protein OmpA-like peptidoglycan-associated protein